MERIYEFQVDVLGKLADIETESAQANEELLSIKNELDRTNGYLAMIESHKAKAASYLSSISLSLYVLIFLAALASFKLF